MACNEYVYKLPGDPLELPEKLPPHTVLIGNSAVRFLLLYALFSSGEIVLSVLLQENTTRAKKAQRIFVVFIGRRFEVMNT